MPARALLVFLAIFFALRANAAPSLSELDRAADYFCVAVASRVLALGISTPTLHVAPLEPSGLEAEALRELLVQRLQGSDRVVLLGGPDASEKADLLVTGRLIALNREGPEIFLRLTDRKSGVLLLAAHRHIDAPLIGAAVDDRPNKIQGPTEALRSRAVWVVSAGRMLKGEDWGWNAGFAYRSVAYPLEVALEGGGYKNDQRVELKLPDDHLDVLSPQASVNYVRARADYLYPIKYVRDPFGNELFKFPGYLRLGGGLGFYNVKLKEEIRQKRRIPGALEEFSYSEAGSHLRLVPLIDAGIVRSIGTRLEISATYLHVLSFEHFGYKNMTFGGPEFLLQLGYRFY